MPVYYNEFDPYAAQWLRNLIAAGHLPEGDVDERSILEVSADDLKDYDECHFFAGIGGWPLALRWAGWGTPSTRDWKDTPGMSMTGTNPDGSTRARLDQLPRQAALASGPPLTSSHAATENRGALNPAFSLWLMGFPPHWMDLAPSRESVRSGGQATPSSQV